MDRPPLRFQRRWLAIDCSELLPAEILERADARGHELAWRISDIPAVIEAAERANLLNLGGDLQIRAPSGGVGEPIGMCVDTEGVAEDLPWQDQVRETARVALADFHSLQSRFDFVELARESYPTLVGEVEQVGGDAAEVVFFRWLVADEQEGQRLRTATGLD
jgi:hypothetical protein